MRKIFLFFILTIQFLFSTYLAPNAEDWSSRFKAKDNNEKTKAFDPKVFNFKVMGN